MTGYTRQSATDIIDGEIVEAGPLNAEFDKLVDTFDATTGHPHDGTTAGGPKLVLTAAVSGILPVANGGTNSTLSGMAAGDDIVCSSDTALTYRKNNYAAVTAPVVGSDSSAGYAIGSGWLNTVTGLLYVATSVAVGAAVWINVTDPAAIAAAFGKVKNTSADTTPDYLNSKITVSGIAVKSTTSPAGNEKLNIDVTVNSATTAVEGITTLATAAETSAGTVATKAITPAGLAGCEGDTAFYVAIFGL